MSVTDVEQVDQTWLNSFNVYFLSPSWFYVLFLPLVRYCLILLVSDFLHSEWPCAIQKNRSLSLTRYSIVSFTDNMPFIWHCLRSMWSRVCVMVGRLSVCPSAPAFSHHMPLRRVCCCGPGLSVDCCMAGCQRHPRHCSARSSRCGQCHVVSWCRKLNKNLFLLC